MQDRKTNVSTVTVIALWSVTACTYLLAGILLALGAGLSAIYVAEIACGLSAFAAVQHIRTYALQICGRIDNIYEIGRDVGRLEAVPPQRAR